MESMIKIYQDTENKLSSIVARERAESGRDIWKEVPRDFLRSQHIFVEEEAFPWNQRNKVSFMIDFPELLFAGNLTSYRRLVLNSSVLKTDAEKTKATIYEYACYLLNRKYWEYFVFGKPDDDPFYQVSGYSPNYEIVRTLRQDRYLHVTGKVGKEADAYYLMFYLMGEHDDKVIPYLGYNWAKDGEEVHEGKIIQLKKKKENGK